jgi:hypothetical protein
MDCLVSLLIFSHIIAGARVMNKKPDGKFFLKEKYILKISRHGPLKYSNKRQEIASTIKTEILFLYKECMLGKLVSRKPPEETQS